MLPWALGLGALLLGLLVLYGFHPLKRWRYRHLPGPRPRWLLGNLVELLRDGQEAAHANWCREFGPGPTVIWMGGIPVVLVDNPALARKVLVRPARHKLFTLHVGEQAHIEQNFLLFQNGLAWKETRNAWQPFFRKDVVESSGEVMAGSIGSLCRQLAGAAEEGSEVEIHGALGRMTMDVVGSCAFGVDFRTQEQPEGRRLSRVHTPADRLVCAVQDFFALFAFGNPLFALFFLFPDLEWLIKWLINALPNATHRREMAARRSLNEISSELVRQGQAAAQRRASGDGSAGGQRPQAIAPGSFLSLVLPSIGKQVCGSTLDDVWAAAQASGFILAGYETTANALAFCVYLLSCNPDKEATLLAEVDAFGRHRAAGPQDLAAFPYAHAALQEALRIYPPAHTAIREAPAGIQLGGLDIPGDAALQVSIYSMHRNERWWRDPLAFKPERFLSGTPEAEEVVEGAFVPFGAGARKCIGYRFAELEAVLSLVCLYQQFTFQLLPGQQPLKVKTALTMAPDGGIRVTVHKR